MQNPTIINFDGSDEEYGGPVYQGSTFEAWITIRNSSGTPLNLSTYNVRGMGRKNFSDPLPTFTFVASFIDTVENGITYPSSTIRLYLPASEGANATRTIPSGTYKYDVELELISNIDIVVKPIAGKIKFTNEASK